MQNHKNTKQFIKDVIQWDVRSWSKALKYWDRNVDWQPVHTGLEVGGREGGLTLWLALKGIDMVCSDLANVKKTAEPLHLKYNVTGHIKYQDIDATDIPYENYFDVIVFKSIIGGIGRDGGLEIQKKVFDALYKALKPGGKLLFAENLVASPLHQKLRKKFVNWQNYWHYVSVEDMSFFLKDFSKVNMKTTGFLGTLGRTEAQRNFLSVIDDLFLNRFIPHRWKYIVYGIAVK